MRHPNPITHHFPWTRAIATATFLLAGCQAIARQEGPKAFPDAESASMALFKAVQGNDAHQLLEILGPDGRQIASSGDEAEDAQARASFVAKFQQMHRIAMEPDGFATLYIGAENWPTPIPLKARNGAWTFDTEAGKDEILLRRIGFNETSTIHVCRGLAEAQEEFRSIHKDGFARTVRSSIGLRDGLYWPAGEGEIRSPIGPRVAAATLEGPDKAVPTPYRGYCYRMLPAQGKGFAVVAFPAEYRSSGVMTFLITQKGVVYEKDLGAGTAGQVRRMQAPHVDSTWTKAAIQPE